MSVTAFERRKRRIRVSQRDRVLFDCGAELSHRLDRLDRDLVAYVVEHDPSCSEFLEWYAEEWRKYGPRVADGLVALYWRWLRSGVDHLDQERFESGLEDLASRVQAEILDEERVRPLTLVQEFVWRSAGDWVVLDYLAVAIADFVEYRDAGKMPDWRRRKRRREQANRRKKLKAMLKVEIPVQDEAA